MTGLAAVPAANCVCPKNVLPVAVGITIVVVLPEATAVVTTKSKYAPVLALEAAGILITLSCVPWMLTILPDWAIVKASVTAPEASQVVITGLRAVSVEDVAIVVVLESAPVDEIVILSVKAPVVSLLVTPMKPPSERTGPEKVVLAILKTPVVASVSHPMRLSGLLKFNVTRFYKFIYKYFLTCKGRISYVYILHQKTIDWITNMYNFKTKPYKHQLDTFEESKNLPSFALFMEMGTGKTKVTIDTFSHLFEKNKIDSVLILAPKSVYRTWAEIELPKHVPDRINTEIFIWNSYKKDTKKYRDELEKFCVPKSRKPNKLYVFIMNIEALSQKKETYVFQVANYFIRSNPKNFMIVDESTTIKQSKSNRTKHALKISCNALYKRILTGSPITQNPSDLYSQFKFLDPKILDFPNDFVFEKRYAIKKELRFGNKTINKIVGWQRQDELYSLISPHSIRILKSDCLDLPPKIYQKRSVELTSEQRRHYIEMKEMALTALSNEDIITVHSSVLPLISKLQQIVCGFIKDTHKNKTHDIKNNRISAVMDVLQEVNTGKVIIWSNFVYSIQKINEEIASKYGKESVASFYGDVSVEERQNIINNFQNPTHPLKYFVGNQQTGGMGITLTEANTVIYFSNNYKYDDRIQSEDRCHRIGQRKTVTYIDLCSEKTVDDRILWILKDKNNISKTVLKEDIQDWIV